MSNDLGDFEEFLKALLTHSAKTPAGGDWQWINSTTPTGQPYDLSTLKVQIFRAGGPINGWGNARILNRIQSEENGYIRPGMKFKEIRREFPTQANRNLDPSLSDFTELDFTLPWDLDGQITSWAEKRIFGRCFTMGMKAFMLSCTRRTLGQYSGSHPVRMLECGAPNSSIQIKERGELRLRDIEVTIRFPQVDGLRCVVYYKITGKRAPQKHAEVIMDKILALVYLNASRRLHSVLGRQLTGRTPSLGRSSRRSNLPKSPKNVSKAGLPQNPPFSAARAYRPPPAPAPRRY